MQRLFSMFPRGAVGLALIVLRACVLASLWMTVMTRGPVAPVGWTNAGSCILCVSIAVGIMTPAACMLTVAIEVWSIWHRPLGDPGQFILGPLLAVVLGLLGPGAISMDARLFGRRRILVDKD